MTSQTPAIVTVSRRFEAQAETVFDAFLDPDAAGRFMFNTPGGEMVNVEIDPRVGGTFNFTDRRDGEDVVHTGEYLEIDRPRRLVFTLRVEKYSQHTDRVAIDIEPLDDGCELTLTHQISPHLDTIKGQVEDGWQSILEATAAVLGEASVKQLYVQQSVDIDAAPAAVWKVLTDPVLSRRWIETWWPGVTLESDWGLNDPVTWTMDDGMVGARGEVTMLREALEPMAILAFTFEVEHEGARKVETIKYFLSEERGGTKLQVFVGNFGDSPEHEGCYPGAEEAWKRSLPKIRELAEGLRATGVA